MPPRSRKRGGATSNFNTNSNNNSNNSKNSNNNTNSNSSSRKSGRRSNNNGNNNRRQNHHQGPKIQPQPITDDPATLCTVCANRATDWALGPCGHAICGDCAHRLRVLYKRTTCVICSQPQNHIVVISLSHWHDTMSYNDALSLLPPSSVLREEGGEVGMSFMDRTRETYFRNIRGWKCSHKSCANKPSSETVFNNATQLRAHARSEHRTLYCEICFTGEKSFVAEMPQFPLDQGRNSSGALRAHLRKTHPQCKFCHQYYLDDDKLYAHLQEAHETCSICERAGRMHEYYLNFEQLEQHYQSEHYMCAHEGCRGVVFATAIDLQTHMHTQHSGHASNSSGSGGPNPRSRALRVNLQQLHEGGRNDINRHAHDEDVALERERQAARRRAFLSSHVVFTGALLNEQDSEPPLPQPSPSTLLNSNTTSTVTATSTTSSTNTNSRPNSNTQNNFSSFQQQQQQQPPPQPPPPPIPRPPDDGKFHPSRLPRDAEESTSRNTILVRRMRSLLDPAAYEQFKQSSARFSDGSIDTDKYFDAAVDAFGVRAAVRDVLPELVALLPSPLLREPLLRTCLRRTDTPFSETDLDPTVSALASTSSSVRHNNTNAANRNNNDVSAHEHTENEQFPTLNGGPAPPPSRRANRLRRFGAPGPEEFPRLARANPPGPRPTPPVTATSSSSSSAAPTTTTSTATQNRVTNAPPSSSSSSSSAPPPQQKTAASILRETGPAAVRVSRNRSALASSSTSSSAATRPQFGADAFPSLASQTSTPSTNLNRNGAGNGSSGGGGFASAARAQQQARNNAHHLNGSRQQQQTPLSDSGFPALTAFPSLSEANPTSTVNHSQSEIETETESELDSHNQHDDNNNTPNSDVSLRAGAVWGVNQHNGRRKRGPGQGRGRRPATPPRVALQALEQRQQQNEALSSQEQSNHTDNDGDDDNNSMNSSSSGGAKLKVIDVMEIARERRRAVQHSALPGLAKNAFGGGSIGSSSRKGGRKF